RVRTGSVARLIWTRGRGGAWGVRAPPASSESASPLHAGRAGGDSAPATAFGAWPRACTGRHTPRAPHHTGHRSPAAAGRSRHGVASPSPSPSVRSLFPRFTSPPRPRGLSPTWPRQRPTTARPPPPSPHASPLHVSTRAATDHPPTDCDRVSLLLDCTVPSRSGPDSLSLAGGLRFEVPHVSSVGQRNMEPGTRWPPRVAHADRDIATRPDRAGADGPDAPGPDHAATTVPVEA
ncbi:hypothetical protein PVAP13_5NG586350, partial [Panicum virgatum]